MEQKKSFLIIQTAYIGDVILATAVAEKIYAFYPQQKIDFLVKKGCESLFKNHPFIGNIFILEKKNKLRSILENIKKIRHKNYDVVINLHRFGSSGLITFLSGAKEKYGFKKNPFSFCYTQSFEHEIGNGKHETERNQKLIAHLTDEKTSKPKLYPSTDDFKKTEITENYVVMAPSSIWFTKQLPENKWVELIEKIPDNIKIFLTGASADKNFCEQIIKKSNKKNIENIAGKFSLLESAALIKNAKMNYVNDSAPLHLCSAMNAPVTAFFCSTVPQFGFTPLSDQSKIIEISEPLDCRPCGIHGHKSCPQGHFKCASQIKISDAIENLSLK